MFVFSENAPIFVSVLSYLLINSDGLRSDICLKQCSDRRIVCARSEIASDNAPNIANSDTESIPEVHLDCQKRAQLCSITNDAV